jgi:adenine-specific DNA-methyltransferase
MKPADCQPQLQQPYRRENWQKLLPQLLPGVEMFSQAHDFPLTSESERGIATARRQFGAATLADGKRVAFYEIEVAPGVQLQSNRVGLRSLIVKCIDEVSAHAVLAFFVQPGKSFYRLTYAARESKLGDDLKIQTEQTVTRRFTYILGAGESCRTAAERFGSLPAAARLADLTEAFSVEKLNKEFFADFRKAFELVAKNILDRNHGWENADADRETQTLLSRLLFLYFIQRKGWLNRQRDYLVSAFNRHHVADRDGVSFYDQFLRPFFVKLSADDAYFPNLDLGDLPFLNGGLFDDEIGSLTERGRMKVGNPVLRQVFDNLLESYNFTVREDTPLDQEVAIDPEMLGKIFESLVLQLEQSDTGGKTSRHDTGSYYTPRPIVHYLCREGLRVWLEQFPPSLVVDDVRSLKSSAEKKSQSLVTSSPTNNDWPARLEKLFVLDATDGLDAAERVILNDLLTPDEARALLDRLDNFRACDLAVGSGAFLVGLLHELVNLRRLCETRARGKDPATDIEWLYETKKRVIENVLYGVDIQQRAVEICKLRLWISLMVDYPLEVDPDNCALPDFRRAIKKITPLPNLDFKIRRANSLIEQIRGHAVKFPQTAADSRDFALSLSKLVTAKHRFYEARRKKDKRLTQLNILEATAELAKYEFSAAKLKFGLLPSDQDAERAAVLDRAEAEMGKLQMQIAAARKKNEREKDDDIERLSRVFNDEAKPTFVWQLDFAEIFHRRGRGDESLTSLLEGAGQKEKLETPHVVSYGGFDLVLANPPYVRHEKIKELKPFLENAYDCYTGTADLYVYFFERAVKLLNDGGVLSFISSNKFFRAGYGGKLRKYLAEKTELQSAIDFGDLPIFEATAYPCIIVTSNRAPKAAHQVRTLNVKTMAELDRFTELAKSAAVPLPQESFGENSWQLGSPAVLRLLEKLSRAGKPLREFVGARVSRGLTTGLNEAFVVDRATRDRLVREHKSSAEILKPYMRGKDINRWRAEFADQFIVKIESSENQDHPWSGKSKKDAEEIFAKTYPAIYSHFENLRSELINRDDQGKYFWEQRSCKYWQEFGKPKIVSTKISIRPTFALDSEKHYLGNTAYFFPAATSGRFLLGLLNSNLFFTYAKTVFVEKQGGWFEVQPDALESFPIPAASAAEQAALSGLVDGILAAKRTGDAAKVTALEAEIDTHVFRLYALTPAEIELVKGTK